MTIYAVIEIEVTKLVDVSCPEHKLLGVEMRGVHSCGTTDDFLKAEDGREAVMMAVAKEHNKPINAVRKNGSAWKLETEREKLGSVGIHRVHETTVYIQRYEIGV